MTALMTRRAFLGILAASGIAAAACHTPSPGQGNGRRVVVLGAGLAGLSAAYNLMRSGFEVVVLEAPERMLHAYLLGDHAEVLASVPPQERVNRSRAEISRFLPGLDSHIVASYAKVWREDPFAGGAFAFAQPGQLRWIFPAARRPDNRLHFAGEHTSVSIGWMDGALESGERVAAEIATKA